MGILTPQEAATGRFGRPGEFNESGWPLQGLEAIKGLDLPPREPIIGPFSSASTIVVAALRGSGKTMWMTEISQAVASGEPFCDWQVLQAGRVAFVQLDMPIQAVQNRAMQRTWHRDFHYVTRWHFQRVGMPAPDLGDPEQHETIINALSAYRMVVFDTRRAAQPPGAGAAANLWHPSYWMRSAPVRHALADAGVCTVFLDHLNSDGAVKDTKAIEDDVDAVITLKDSDKGASDLCFHVEMPKDRDNLKTETYFEFDGHEWRQFSDASLKRQVQQFRQNHTVKETVDRFGCSERTVRNWVREVNAELREELRSWVKEGPD